LLCCQNFNLWANWQLHIRHSYSVKLFQNHWSYAGFWCRSCMTNPTMNLSSICQIGGWTEDLQQSDLELFPSPLTATETFSPMAQFFHFWILNQQNTFKNASFFQ
jgi:hypothetical protein